MELIAALAIMTFLYVGYILIKNWWAMKILKWEAERDALVIECQSLAEAYESVLDGRLWMLEQQWRESHGAEIKMMLARKRDARRLGDAFLMATADRRLTYIREHIEGGIAGIHANTTEEFKAPLNEKTLRLCRLNDRLRKSDARSTTTLYGTYTSRAE